MWVKLLFKSNLSVSCVHPGTHRSFNQPTLTQLPRRAAACQKAMGTWQVNFGAAWSFIGTTYAFGFPPLSFPEML